MPGMSVPSLVAPGHKGNYIIIGVISVYCLSSPSSPLPSCPLLRLGQSLSCVAPALGLGHGMQVRIQKFRIHKKTGEKGAKSQGV